MDQYLKVVFPTRRLVWIDGVAAAWTNRVFQVETGHHIVTLGPSMKNFEPDHFDLHVTGTLPTAPLIIEFTRRDTDA
ncbi:hypothetical protein [Halomonas heilongjiangensis]|uniref:PEGA domain-containing protein n=1 Tax=Halomonas heilongjiangensis TaxID=1387883 RepID=A0A2N7TFX4_9GAMM|nr:hypothetical protein [Halomonas heilongjiangensis]PMR67086.1 hypothetical protein C1H66_20605 [Halomonas heilongjiangensis]PXX87823.1 hypothetical protein CR158_15865 [Halomonas heilongjiangensis]